MSTLQFTIFKIPSPVLCLIIVGAGAIFSIVGVLGVRYFVPHARLRAHHDVADPILGALAVIYAVLLTFILVNVWQAFDKSNANVELEANYLADIYSDSEAFSPEFHNQVVDLLREYRQAVVDKEWKVMEQGKMSPEVEKLIRNIWTHYTTYLPKNLTEQSFFDESVRKLNSFRELRRQRLMDSRNGLQQLLWFILITGGLSTVAFTFLFGAENLKAQIFMSVLLSVMIALILFAILEMDFPFTGGIRVSSEPFKVLLLD
ncbi:MAG: hypothetical protein WC412_01975 [Candidatus Omnitrophota bacterium]|jgi:hypothetical protein